MAELEPGHPDELCERLVNWLMQAASGIGSHPADVTPTEWAVRNFIDAWRKPVRAGIDSVESSLQRALVSLRRGDPTTAAVEIEHAMQTLAEDVRDELGLYEWNREE
jgi:hypothetical protein